MILYFLLESGYSFTLTFDGVLEFKTIKNLNSNLKTLKSRREPITFVDTVLGTITVDLTKIVMWKIIERK